MRALAFATAAIMIVALQSVFAQSPAVPAATPTAPPPAPSVPPPAPQAQVFDSITPDQMAAALRELGYRASIRALSDGKSKVVATGMDGYNVGTYLLNCDANWNCPSLEFETTIDKDPKFTLALVNSWNSTTRYTKLYIDPHSLSLTFDYDFYI